MDRPLDYLVRQPGLVRLTEAQRAAMTASCRDTHSIPKVPGAGSVSERDGAAVQVMHNGIVVERGCYYGDWMESIIRSLRGHHEPQEEKAFYEVLKRVGPGGRMIELGSFWAYYSLWFHAAIPGATNICCEPDLANLDVGRRNAALNGFQIDFRLGAAGAAHGEMVRHVGESSGEELEVPVLAVDELLTEAGWPYLDILHMDVQGAELAALAGSRKSIGAGRIRYVFVSTHHYAISGSATTHRDCLRYLQDLGAHIVCSHTVHESFSGDGLIVACFGDDLTVNVSLNHTDRSLFRSPDDDLGLLVERTG